MRSKTAPAGRPVGPPRGGICYLDNIEITQANRQTLLLCLSFYAFSKIAKKSIDKYVYVWYTILVSKRYFIYYIGRFLKMLLRDSTGRSVDFHLFASSGVDFAEDWLDAGSLSRDVDGVYLVDSINYIIDYATDAVNGCNPDFEGKLDADIWVM